MRGKKRDVWLVQARLVAGPVMSVEPPFSKPPSETEAPDRQQTGRQAPVHGRAKGDVPARKVGLHQIVMQQAPNAMKGEYDHDENLKFVQAQPCRSRKALSCQKLGCDHTRATVFEGVAKVYA